MLAWLGRAGYVAAVAVAGFRCGRCRIQLIDSCACHVRVVACGVGVDGLCCGRCRIHMTLIH